jgi:hypothetical protein
VAGGRPTKYTPELVAAAYDYIDNYQEAGDMMPSHVGMACAINIAISTLYAWAEDENKEFSDILALCMQKQQRVLFNGGLGGDFNAAITKLALGKHGFSDKQDVEVIDKTPPTPEARKSRIADLLGKCN